ncbi:LVIVD repeat-containing protein [Psychroserpens sp. BH13MA-6]
MKKLVFVFIIICCWSCNNDDNQFETVVVAIPQTITKTALRSAVEIQSPKPILNVGKVYAYQEFIFINEKFKGVHVLDNSNPTAPQQVSFIYIPGNEDISIKNDYLYADSAIDLVVFDIANISSITEVGRLEDVFEIYDYQIPEGADFLDYGEFASDTDVIVGWDLIEERREVSQGDDVFTFDGAEAGNTNTIGVGGSLARFQIVSDYLYTVGESQMNTFDISNLLQPNLVSTTYAGWRIETMFHADGYLYLGGDNGMFIHSLGNPASPEFISEFTHWEGCDPVVVDGNYAYLTLRGGNFCGQDQSVLEVIDVTDKSQPQLIGQYELDNPYGLGFKGNHLFVCDGTSGLKVFDKTDPSDVQLLHAFNDVQATDVIPLNDKLLMISDNALYQYEYVGENTITLLSTYILN